MLFLGLESLSSIVEQPQNIPPKQIMCSLCYGIAYDGRQCNNRKCQNVFCGNCVQKQRLKFLDKDKNEFKCPFCQTFSGYSKLSKDIINFINGFKFYCHKNKNCKEEYTYEQLVLNHKHNNNYIILYKNDKCYVCKKIILETDLNTLQCALCNNIGCYKNICYNAIQNSNNKNDNLKNINDEYCIQRCYICKLPICKYCSKKINYKKDNILNFICDECNQDNKCDLCNNNNAINICIFCKKYLCESCTNKCKSCGYTFCSKSDCLSKKILCENCKNLNSDLNYFECKHKEILNCNKCFQKCYLCKVNIHDLQCNFCLNNICIKNCSVKCKFCSLLYCSKCSLICSICKKITCLNCANFCDECDKYNTLVSCKNCKSNVIKICQYKKDGIINNCIKRLCISCWNVCNYCGTIFCSEHCNSCSNCEDTICDKHFTKCNKCLNKDELTYIKLCIKKCVLRCSFCDNETTVLCKENNHIKNYVHNFGCPHNICNSCIKKCANCGKIVRKCLECIDYFYELCRYCKKYQCLSCCSKCNKCEDVYCSLEHKCVFCNNIFPGKCFNCNIIERNKCLVCKEKFKICEHCKNKFICNFECYRKYRTKLNNDNSDEHLCQMYICKKHFDGFEFSLK